MRPAVVFVHGLFMTGWEMRLLRQRVRRCGFEVYQFRYRSRHDAASVVAAQLHAFVQQLPHSELHFVCHSLGGLVVRHLFHAYPQRPGRVLTLGTPHQPSSIAGFLARYRLGNWWLGKSTVRAILGGAPGWSGSHQIAGICGTTSLGAGLIIRTLSKPNDGTVSLAEAQFAAFSECRLLPVSHMQMLLSREVAAECCEYLRSGHFRRPMPDA